MTRFDSVFSRFTDAERAFAISQLDPFHDEPYRLTGAPSSQNTDSVTIIVSKEMVLSAADFALATSPGDKWDLHVVSLPITDPVSCYPAHQSNPGQIIGRTTTAEDLVFTLSPICASGVPNKVTTFSTDGPTGGFTFQGLSSTLTSYFSSTGSAVDTTRPLRVIGQSFEVVDESPEIYKQGSVCVYERSSNTSGGLYRLVAVPSGGVAQAASAAYYNSISGPPTRIEQATILASAKTWRASEGAYVVARLNGPNEFARPQLADGFVLSPPDPDDPDGVNNSWIFREGFNLRLSGGASFRDGMNMFTPYNVSGAYFTGLSAEFGVYRIRSKVIYEVLPDPTDSSLVSLSTPTLPHNSLLETLLSEIIAGEPAGYPQTDNPKGEVWKKILRGISKTATALTPAMSLLGPEAAALSTALAMGSGAGSRLIKPKPKSKPKSNKK